MAGTLKANAVQLGDSATATQNLTIRTNADGSFTIARGNVGATTQDVLTIDANGRIALPQTVVAFSAYQTAAQGIPTTTFTKIQFPNEEFDTANAFDSVTNYRFQPTVPGYYQVNGSLNIPSTALLVSIYKNGVEFKRGFQAASTATGVGVSAVIYMNGTTDYVELYGFQNSGATVNTAPSGVSIIYFQGVLIAKA